MVEYDFTIFILLHEKCSQINIVEELRLVSKNSTEFCFLLIQFVVC